MAAPLFLHLLHSTHLNAQREDRQADLFPLSVPVCTKLHYLLKFALPKGVSFRVDRVFGTFVDKAELHQGPDLGV